MIASRTFDPEVVEAMTAAYEMALSDLDLVDRSDPLTELCQSEPRLDDSDENDRRQPRTMEKLAQQTDATPGWLITFT
jgi:hypothetical protein